MIRVSISVVDQCCRSVLSISGVSTGTGAVSGVSTGTGAVSGVDQCCRSVALPISGVTDQWRYRSINNLLIYSQF